MKKTKNIKQVRTDEDAKQNKTIKKSIQDENLEEELKPEFLNTNNIEINYQNNMDETITEEKNQLQEEHFDIKYEEPELTFIVVESYEGGKEKGLFEGIGKASYKGGHTYEGDFHAGMMCGKGKYIWSDGTIFEGDFINNEIIGVGTFKWLNKRVNKEFSSCTIYEGEVLKGKRHGFGTFRSENLFYSYTGEWFVGKRHGKGKILYDNEGLSYYEGDWLNNTKYGWGIRRYLSGNIYEGLWINDIQHGFGTMCWLDKNQKYIGQWENGEQIGMAEHHWYLPRITTSQYALRNTYFGDFHFGKRHGQGTFLYANGEKYEGNWQNNLKHGFGRFTFKNGKFYEGYFEEDKMIQSPSFIRDSSLVNDISRVRSRIPSAGITLNLDILNQKQNNVNQTTHLDLDLTSIFKTFPEVDNIIEYNQAVKTIVRHLDTLRKVYRFYSQLGFDSSPDNTYVLNRMQFWRFLKDSKIHLGCFTLAEFDKILDIGNNINGNEIHWPYDKVLIREFYSYIAVLSFFLYKDTFKNKKLILSLCIEKLINSNIKPYSCNVKGYLYSDNRKTTIAIQYMVKSHDVYRSLCTKRKEKPHDMVLSIRNFIYFLKEFQLINQMNLTTKDVITILAVDNVNVFDNEDVFNLELEMVFLDFFEALIGCALKYVNESLLNEHLTPRPSTIMTREHSFLSEASINTHNDIKDEKLSIKINSNKENITKTISENCLDNQNELTKISCEKNITNEIKKDANRIFLKNDKQTNETDKEFINWFQKIDIFFNSKLFPEAEKFQKIQQERNRLL